MDVRNMALELTGRLLQKDYRAEACALLNYCRDNIRYVKDIYSAETLQTPSVTLTVKAGDCDDKSILLGAFLASIGHRARFIAMSPAPGVFSHVWVQDNIRGKWVDLEPTEPLECGERVPGKGVVEYIYYDIE